MIATVEVGEDKTAAVLIKFNLWKTIRITAWIKRFVRNCQEERESRVKGARTTDETDNAIMHLIRKTQKEFEKTDRIEEDRERERLNLQKDTRDFDLCIGRMGDYPLYLPPG